MSKINKSIDSETFDIYVGIMNKYIKKKAGNPLMEGAIALLRAGGSTLESILPAGIKSDDFITEAIQTGLITAEEIAQLTGKSVNEIKMISDGAEIAKDVAEVAVKTAPESAQAVQITSKIADSTRVIRQEANKIAQIARGIRDLEGKSVEEVASMYQALKRSRSAMKGQITKAKKLASQATEQSAELVKLLEDSRAAEEILRRTADSVPALERTIAEMGGQLDEAGRLITKLQDELASSAKTIEELSARGVELTEKNKRLLDTALEKAELAGYYKGLAEAAEQGSAEARTATQIATRFTEESAQASTAITRATPEAAEAIAIATSKASQDGGEAATRAVQKVYSGGDAAYKGTESAKNPFMRKLILQASPLLLSGASTTAFIGLKALKFISLIGIVGIGASLVWNRFFSLNALVTQQRIKKLKRDKSEAVRRLKALRFRDGTVGKKKTDDLIISIITSFNSINSFADKNITQQQFDKANANLDAMEALLGNYLENKKSIASDLEVQDGWPEAIAALESLSTRLTNFKELVMIAMQNAGQLSSSERGVRRPVARPKSEGRSREADHVPQMETIYRQKIDIGHLNRGMRSAARRIIQKVMNSPEGLAFVDPDGVWGGWLQKTPVKGFDGKVIQNKSADYLRALKYLYLNKIFSRGDLRKFVRKNLPKVGRKRISGWRDAVKYYRGRVEKYANQENNEFFTQKYLKPANSNESSVILYNNWKILDMRKKADQVSKEYFQDAVSGLADQYAKSYYTGLKSMYDQKPGRTEADFVKLYKVHNESGADLIGAAHPKSIDIADAMGNGGVVENQIEQHRHNTGVAKSMPSGNFRGKHARVIIIENLVKLADQADELEMKEASDLIDDALKELSSF